MTTTTTMMMMTTTESCSTGLSADRSRASPRPGLWWLCLVLLVQFVHSDTFSPSPNEAISRFDDELSTAESIYPCLDVFNVNINRANIEHEHEVAAIGSRELIRVFWATNKVIEQIHNATQRHLASNRLYPLHHHHHHQHQHHRPRVSQHRAHHVHRPSMLIELRKLNYVREQVVSTVANEQEYSSPPSVAIRCDLFEPKESTYYCFIHVIISPRGAILYESLPRCVPTMLNQSISDDILGRQPEFERKDEAEKAMDTMQTLLGNSLLADQEAEKATSSKANKDNNNQSVNTSRIDVGTLEDEKRNIKQFALKSDRQHQHPTLITQTRACHCSGLAATQRSSSPPSSSSSPRAEIDEASEHVFLNLTDSETAVVNIIITSCTRFDSGEEYSDYEIHGEAEESAAETTTTAAAVAGNEADSSTKEAIECTHSNNNLCLNDKKYSKKNANKLSRQQKKSKKRLKGRRTTTTTSTTTTTTPSTIEPTMEERSVKPTVCILSIDNPHEYYFQVDSIEPSSGLPLEHLNYLAHLGRPTRLDLLDYLQKYSFLVVRNGQYSIDPRMNIENRSQSHYLRTGGHLRLEATSSLNLTLRFRRSAASSVLHALPPPPTTKANKQINLVIDQEVSLLHRAQALATQAKSIIEDSVMYIARKAINLNDRDHASAAHQHHLSAFHVTSVLLAMFITITMLIYALIAYNAHHHHQHQQQPSEVRSTPGNCDLVVESDGNSSSTPKVVIIRHQQDRSHTSPSVEQQSLEIDYYDYAQPLQCDTKLNTFTTTSSHNNITTTTTHNNHSYTTTTLPHHNNVTRPIAEVTSLSFTKPPTMLLTTFANNHTAKEV